MFKYQIYDYSSDCEREIIYNGEQFPDDKTLEEMLRDIHKKHLEKYDGTLPENFQIKMPIEFRTSTFAKQFSTNIELGGYECRMFSDQYQNLCDMFDTFDISEDHNATDKICQNDECQNFAKYKILEVVGGFGTTQGGFLRYFCDSCAKNFNALENEICICEFIINSTKMISPIIRMILDYLKSPFTLGKIDEKDRKIGAFTDWVQFMFLYQDETSVAFLINCNLKSPLYSWVMTYDYCGQMQLVENIKTVEEKFKSLVNI